MLGSDGEIWFFANDVLQFLGYTDVSHTLADHTSLDDRKALKYSDWVKLTETKDQNKRKRIFINESGLYCQIFASKKPEAESFKLWVTHEVLPSIRKNGRKIFLSHDVSAIMVNRRDNNFRDPIRESFSLFQLASHDETVYPYSLRKTLSIKSFGPQILACIVSVQSLYFSDFRWLSLVCFETALELLTYPKIFVTSFDRNQMVPSSPRSVLTLTEPF